MRHRFRTVLYFLSFLLWSGDAASVSVVHTVCFVPGQDCKTLITQTISQAKQSIRVQAYGFTSAPIAEALVDAAWRGIDVQVIVDKSQLTAKKNKIDFLRNAGVPVLVDRRHAIAHNKIIVIDGQIVVTGSFNFTDAAQTKNAENVVVINDPATANQYLENWYRHADHATDGSR